MIGAGFVCLGYWFYQSLDVIYLIVAALIIAISSEGLILSLEKRIKSRAVAIGVSYFLLLLFVFSGIVVIIPFLLSQASLLVSWLSSRIISIKDFVIQNTRPDAIYQISFLPDLVKEYLVTHWNNFNRYDADFQSSILSGLNTLLESSTGYFKQFSAGFFSFIGGFFGLLCNLGIVFTLAVFFSIEKEYLTQLLAKPFSSRKSYALHKINDMYHKLSLWLKARVYLSLFIFSAIGIALWLLGFL